MSDDIDIEEHNVLDNPRIRNMFPDISSIKTEVEDYEDEDTSIDVEEDYHRYNNRVPFVFEEEINIKPFNNKIIIGSKPCVSTSKTQGTGTSFQGTKVQETSLQGPEVQGTSLQGTEVQGTSLQGTELQGTSILSTVLQGTSFQGTGLEETILEEGNDNRHTVLQETETSETSLLLQERKFQNKIIVGSKTQSSDNSERRHPEDSGEEGFDLPEVSVVLEDCNHFLEGNPCFCEECGTLFATDNDMDAHKMISHSFLVAVSKNKALKSTSKSYANSDSKSLLCNHCNTVFPNTLALLRHTYELLPGKFSCDKCDSLFDNDTACKEHSLEHHTDVSNVTGPHGMFALCKICTCHFKWTGKLRVHMQKFHHTDNVGEVKHVKSNFQCYFCSSKLLNSKRYNIHIWKYHSKLYYGSYNDFEKISKFQCPKCNLCFSSDYSVRIHLAAKHGYLGNMQDSKKLANLNKNPVESKKLPSPSKLPAISQKNETHNIRKTRPIPKSTLFKCNKCHVHFVSCISAVLHSRSCVVTPKKSNFKCQQCRREFKLQDKFYHEYQHRISVRFKVIEITRNILNRIICKCKSCEICFDEKSFMTFHTDSCNADTPSVQCQECNVWIHEKAMGVHKKIHASGLTFKDFIITEYVHASIAIKEQEKTDLIDKYKRKTFKVIKGKRLFDKTSYFYCPTCKCCLRTNKYANKHYIGQCISSDKYSTTCKSCGLRFTKKSFQNHRNIHKMYPKLKLKDLKFINIQTSKRIAPPFPNFKKCNKCKVAFFSAGALNNHACNSDESKICMYCKGKFSDLAYKLHIAFHEYTEKVDINEVEKINDMATINENIPELMKKYESLKQVWNILYLCEACDIVIDTYDKVVEHCQDHFCNMQSYNVTIEHCDICDLNFVDDCFKRHEKLHLNNDMDKDSFIILGYKYENLLSESWMYMFRSLAKEQIQLILSKSMYKFTRCARMKVVSNGALELTLYQCAKCLVIVAPNKVMEHSQNVNNSCENTKQTYGCAHCTLRFAFKSHRIVHEKSHEIRKLDSKSFRIIQFHADKQFSVTELKNEIEVGRKKDPEGLKFIRCQHCGKLIKKMKYKGHTKHHIYYNNYKNKAKNTKQNIQQQKTQPRNPNKILNFYVCRECKVCVAKDSIKAHICDFNGSKTKCVKCSLVFRSQNIASHYKSHEKKIFNRSNMQVMYFDGEVIDKKPAKRRALSETKRFDKKLVTVYQCSQCTLCIWVKCNLSRHVCSPPSYQFTCKICGLTFLTSRRRAHEEMHNVQSFNRKNVHLIKFNNRTASKPKSTSPVSHKPQVSSSRKEINRRNVEKRKLLTNCEDTVAKKPRIDNVQLLGDFVAQSHNRYYKCKTCKLLFLTLTGLIEHEFSCKTDRYAANCEKCGLVFHASMIDYHKTLVNCKMFTKDSVYILTIKQIGKDYNTSNNWIYQCINCDSISSRGLQYHLNANHKIKMAIQTCVQCNIKFTSNSYASHLKNHHGKVDFDISELSIGAVEDITLAEALKDLPNDNQVVYGDYPNKKTEFTLTTSSVYPCDICGLNFIRHTSLLKHKSRGRHNEKQFTCGVCNLKFTQRSLSKHMEIHHKNHKIDNNDAEMINTDINNGVLDSIFDENQSQSTIDCVEEETDIEVLSKDLVDDKNCEDIDRSVTASFNDKSTNNVRNSSSPTKTAESVAGIYNCDVCNMNFVHPTSLRRHQQADKHNEAQHTCKECGLIFSLISLKKHIDIHHNIYRKKYPHSKRKPKIDINDSIVESVSRMFDSNQPNTSSIQENIINTKNITSTNNQPKPSTTEENNIETNDVKASQSIENNHSETNNAISTEELNKNKLFKCSICNVYFLTADDCKEHTTDHIQLDTFEYIACKICDLQFCCEFLGRHMRSHREKTFSLDDLIVAEYHPNNNGEVKIDTYLFVKTKLVSTTTHFDTEIVDSTTENLVESQSVALNDASESAPCIEAVTGSET